MAEDALQSRAASVEPTTLEDNVGIRILRLAEVFARLAKLGVAQPWGLRQTDLRILNLLDGRTSVPISEIARLTYVDKAWISRSVRELVDKGLVARSHSPNDSRMSLAMLTEQGRALLNEIRPSVLSHEQKVLEGIDERAFKLELERLLANADAMLQLAESRQPRA